MAKRPIQPEVESLRATVDVLQGALLTQGLAERPG